MRESIVSLPTLPESEPEKSPETDSPGRIDPGLLRRAELLVGGVGEFLRVHAERASSVVAQRGDAQSDAQSDFARRTERAADELARRTDKASTQLADAVAKLEAEDAENRAEINRRWDLHASKTSEQFEQRAERIERKRREVAWLAETVLESSRPKPRQAYDAVHKRVESGLKAIADWEGIATSLWPGVSAADGATERNDADVPDVPDAFEALVTEVEDSANQLDKRMVARFFRTGIYLVAAPVLAGGAGAGLGVAQAWAQGWQTPVIVGGGVLVALAVLLIPLRARVRKSFRQGLGEHADLTARARASGRATRDRAQRERDDELTKLAETCRREIDRAAGEAKEALELLEQERDADREASENRRSSELDEVARSTRAARAVLEDRVRTYTNQSQDSHAEAMADAQRKQGEVLSDAGAVAEDALARLRADWEARMTRDGAELADIIGHAERASPPWAGRLSGSWTSPDDLSTTARLGVVEWAIGDLLDSSPAESKSGPALPRTSMLPVAIDTRTLPSVLVEAGPAHRDAGLGVLQTTMLRVLSAIPAGRAKLTIVDPVGRGRSFAGLMRLADHDEGLVGHRIWTESRHIEQRLTDLTEHIENVIQKYLRDDYATIDEYNRIAGEIAEPYRYLVLADFPANFSEDSVARLASIIDAGPRCGVFVVMLADPDAKQPAGFDLNELRTRALVLRPAKAGGGFALASKELGDLPFTPDDPPTEAQTAELLDRIGVESLSAGKVEVRYRVVEPSEDRRWTRSAANELRIPVGRAGATKAQELRLGKGTSQHVLIAGKTGSGKSTLLHVLTTAAMLWHDPGEVEFYLVDFKKGVEFKPYASGKLPHVRAVAIESDREFGLSILQRLDDELRRRGDMFRDRGIQGLAQFREKHPDEALPRTILIIDEFQEFFTEDDRIAQDASLLLDRLVRQGRAFGIHVLLASQTLSGAYSLARSTVGQMAVRIALKCSETDSYLILSEDNAAARLLTRPGEAIYNDANGLLEGNNPFQVAWLGDDQRDQVLGRIEQLSAIRGVSFEEPVLFEGNAAAEFGRNRLLRRAIAERQRPIAPIAWFGEPVSIKDPTGAVMRRRGGANMLIVGQRTETAAAMLASASISIASQHDSEGERAPRFLVVDGTPDDDPLAGRLAAALEPLPHDVRPISWRDAPEAVAQAHAEMNARENANRTDAPAWYVVMQGIHWLRSLRRKDDDFSFSLDSDKGPAPDQQLKQLLIDGPRLGIFVLAWCDTTASLTRAMDRASIAEFGNRVLMQMSANDSSMLIESTSAGRLGLHRAIFYDEERGAEEKFRPYGMPDGSLVPDLGIL